MILFDILFDILGIILFFGAWIFTMLLALKLAFYIMGNTK